MLKNIFTAILFITTLFLSIVSYAEVAKTEHAKDNAYSDVVQDSLLKDMDVTSTEEPMVSKDEKNDVSTQTVVSLLLVALVGFVGLSNRSSV